MTAPQCRKTRYRTEQTALHALLGCKIKAALRGNRRRRERRAYECPCVRWLAFEVGTTQRRRAGDRVIARIVVTGTRHTRQAMRDPLWHALEACLAALGPELTVAHGAHRGGVDAYTSQWARLNKDRGVVEDPHPVSRQEWREKGKGAGPTRNRRMLRIGASLLLAAPLAGDDPQAPSKGTFDCIRAAEGFDIPVARFPFGELDDLLLMITTTEEITP